VIEQRTESLHARLELIETAHGARLGPRDIDAPLARPFAFLDSTYAAATKLLRLAPSAPPDCGVRGAGTLRFYLEGLGRTRAAGAPDESHHAIDVLELACNTEPEAAVSRAALATAQLKLNIQSSEASWLAAAEATAREAVALDSVRAESHRALAAVFATQKRNDEALAEFARTVELNPTDDESCLRLGRVYHRLGRSEDERLAYLATSRARPHCWPPYWWLATFYFRESRLDEAVAAYDDMIRRAPAFYKGYSSLAGVLILRGEYPRAIQLLRQSIALRPTKIAFDNLGTAYFNSGRFAEAVDAYNQSFQFGFASYESWLNLGDAYYWLRNRKDNAAQAYVQAVRLGREERQKRRQSGHTEDVMILANLATVFPKLGQPDSARVYLRGALAADSTNPVVRYCAALTQWQLNDQSHAMTSLEAAVHGGYPVVWLRDSPVFSEWRELPAFRALVDSVGSKPRPAASSNRGG
jgi:tetratricopeptide (TPR) repeat protein